MRLRALFIALFLPASLFFLVAALLDPFPIQQGESSGRERRAAMAIRDPVHPVEKLFTKAFVVPYLERCYGEVRYFVQRQRSLWGLADEHREVFPQVLAELQEDYERVDLFLLGHTNHYVAWLEGAENLDPGKLGLVYNSGCRCGKQAERWKALGAKAYVAHPEAASHAPFFVYLLRRWCAGWVLQEAVHTSNERSTRLYRNLEWLSGGESHAETQKWEKSLAEVHGDGRWNLAAEVQP
ncbi:MAG: hypothetical protein DWQ01_01620 [Planctomycetota bacterium]|nr:MAG: hypothetical protein DWQ01_01620 [Planctomycetota bacterium]